MLPRVALILRKFEILLVVLLVLGAAWLRFDNVVGIPGGFHGDEAVAGMEGQRILREGSIGPYSPPALGQPSGPLYLTALSVRLFGPTAWAVRSVSALFGTLTILLFWWMLRRHRGRSVAMLGAILLATLDWHLHFSRLGFPISSWPLCVVAATFAALEAAKRGKAWLWGLAGFLTGVGIYSYNAHILFIAALGAWLLCFLVRYREVSVPRRIGWLLCFGVALSITAVPMARYALDRDNDYFSHARSTSIFNPPDSSWTPGVPAYTDQKTSTDKLRWLGGRVVWFWDNLSVHSQTDRVDATGIVPVVPLGVLVMGVLGVLLTLRRGRDDLRAISLWCVLLLPLGPMFTVDGLTRRAFALSPFLVFLCAVGIMEAWKRAYGPTEAGTGKGLTARRVAATGLAVVVCVALVGRSLSDYFRVFAPAPERAWIFVQDYTDMCSFLHTLPPTTHVLFYSERWSCDYEPRQFLVPNVSIENRSAEFSESQKMSFVADPHMGPNVFVLMGAYLSRLEELKRVYPGSRVQVGPASADTGKPSYVAVWPRLAGE